MIEPRTSRPPVVALVVSSTSLLLGTQLNLRELRASPELSRAGIRCMA